MTRANIAGLTRLPLIFLAAYFLLTFPTYGHYITSVIVVIAIITDILDGYFARRDNTISNFGVFLDLTADKIFICPLLFLISLHDHILIWFAIVTSTREFLVMGIRAYLAAENIVLPAKLSGKIKTILMYPAVIFVLLDIPGGVWLLGLSMIFVVVSAFDYIFRAWPTLKRGIFPNRIPSNP